MEKTIEQVKEETAKQFLEKQGWSQSDKVTFDFDGLCNLLEKFKEESSPTFQYTAENVMHYMAKNHHPNCTLIATSTNVEVFEGIKSTGFVDKYISDNKDGSKNEISHASEVYPDCSLQFACGVHTWINSGKDYDQRLMHQESEDFRNGFYQAQKDLGCNYKMKR